VLRRVLCHCADWSLGCRVLLRRDCTCRVWSTDRIYPLRLLVGHRSDVEVVSFHPNCQYIATGSADCSVRLWDIAQGGTARILLGHQAAITALAFSPDGRSLFTAAADGRWVQFDIASARIVQQANTTTSDATQQRQQRQQRLTALAVSGEGDMLATGSLQGQVSVWDVNRSAAGGSGGSGAGDMQPLQTWRTKSAAITHLHFTPRNLLLAAGLFQGV